MRPWMVLAPLLAGCMLLPAGCARLKSWRKSESPQTLASAPRIGAPAPALDAVDFEGQPVKLSDYRGQVVVVAFWASWCGPCLKLIPHEREIAERFQGKPFAMIGVNNDAEPEQAQRIIRSQGIFWRNCKTCGTDDPINQRWGVQRWPSVHVIDADGILRYSGVTGPALDQAVATLVAEAERSQPRLPIARRSGGPNANTTAVQR